MQSDISLARSENMRLQSENEEMFDRLTRREQQVNQANNELTSLRYLQDEINEKDALILRMRAETNEIRI
jgi:predicted nuclease with TOPRIM domain